MSRPAVDVVVPFRGTSEERDAVLARMRALHLREGDTLTLADNGPDVPPGLDTTPELVHAPDRPTSYHARNRGAARGAAEWIVFIDADVLPPSDLLDRYFDEPPAERDAVLAGGVRDEVPDDLAGLSAAARYTAWQAPMSQDNTLVHGDWAYAQTANAAMRRAAFEEVGGFDERPRSGGDADICFRLRAAGWQLSSRPGAAVVHRNRTTLRALARQRARHGAGTAWLRRVHPGFDPPQRPIVRWTSRELLRAGRVALRGEREDFEMRLVAIVFECSFAAGRLLLPNEPRPRRVAS